MSLSSGRSSGDGSDPKETAVPEAPARTGKPTLKTISQLSGLAVPTVSRALNDAPDIGAQTKALVRRIADEIGYVPNRAGVRLRTGRTNVISLVISTDHDNQTGRLISSIAGALRGTSYHMIITPYFPDEDPMRPIRYIVETGSADAIIFNQTEAQDARVRYLLDLGFPFVTHGRDDLAERHAYFDFDNTAFGRIAVDRLARMGRRHIAVVAPPMAQNYAQNTLEGATTAARRHGLDLIRVPGVTSDDRGEQVRAVTEAFLRAHPQVDGLICSSTSATMAVVGALEGCGHRLGEDIDVFAKGSVAFLRLFRPGLQVVEEHVREAGEFLARAAIQAIREPDLPSMQGLDVPSDTDVGQP
ncbi:MAG: substrate-binding domain-containing protein [Rubellimicrobium sp.]|nr:substrate-binding domain-containing protein [Rubellimicrobium sp.]